MPIAQTALCRCTAAAPTRRVLKEDAERLREVEGRLRGVERERYTGTKRRKERREKVV